MSEKPRHPKPEADHAPGPPGDHAAERLRQFERARGLSPEQSPENAKSSANPPLPAGADKPAPGSGQEKPAKGPAGPKP